MAETTSPAPGKDYPAELRDLFQRANRGDESTLPGLKKALDEYPEFVGHFGDLVRHAEDALLRWATPCLTAREAIARQVAEMRARLLATAATELERLLVDRVVISWIEVYTADVHFADRTPKGAGATPAAQAAQKLLDRAHQRYLSAIRTLATVQKLARPSPSPVDIATRLGGTPPRAAVRPAMPVSQGVAVEN